MDQIIQAVDISISPGASQDLRRQAMEFLQQVKESEDSWQLCLQLFTDGWTASEFLRVFALDVVSAAILRRYRERRDNTSIEIIRDILMKYVHRIYGCGSASFDSPAIQNKLTQALTYLFIATYDTSWSGFFDEILSITSTNKDAVENKHDNFPGVVLYLRLVSNIHDEVADVLVVRTTYDQQRSGLVKDQIRERDIAKLTQSWKEILKVWKDKNDDIVEMTLRVIGKWASWINISFVLNNDFSEFLWTLLACKRKVKEACVDTLAEIVGKKMDSLEKFRLIELMNFVEMLAALIAQDPDLHEDQDLNVDYAERVSRLVNNVGGELVKCLDLVDEAKSRGISLLQRLIPSFFYCFTHEYDDVSTAVFPFATDFLAFYKKYFHSRMATPPIELSLVIPQLLDAIILKLKFDETAKWGDEDELTDEAEFHEVRKRLRALQDSLAVIDEDLVLRTISTLVSTACEKYARGGAASVNWREMDLAMYEIHALGDLAYHAGSLFMKVDGKGLSPAGPPAAALMDSISEMVNSNIATYPHPAILLQYMEIVVRYSNIFEAHKELVPLVLENFVRGIHTSHNRVKTRSWYLFSRFVKMMRPHIGNIAENVIAAVGDLLEVKAEQLEGNDDGMSDDGNKQDATFDSQLCLFEAVGILSSTNTIPQEKQVAIAREIMNPLFSDIEYRLPIARTANTQAVLQIHHDILALGTLARGFSDWAPGTKSTAPPPTELISNEFARAAEGVLISLENLDSHETIREAARFAFVRLIGVLGPSILPLLPRWIHGLLGKGSSMGEIQMFLRLLEQVIHGFKTEIFDVLNSLLTPLLERIFAALGTPVEGTDDHIKLGELRREYLTFLLSILSNDMGEVFTSDTNLAVFEKIIQTIQHFAAEVSDPSTQKLSFSLMNKLTQVLHDPALSVPAQPNGNKKQLVEFSGFALLVQKFSAACWAVPTDPSFNPKDAQSKMVLMEIGALQKSIYLKTGDEFLAFLRDIYFASVGVPKLLVEKYLAALQQMPLNDFKKFFKDFAQGRISA